MGNFILVTLLATHPVVSSVMTHDECVKAQQYADERHCLATCVDVSLMNRFTLLTSSGVPVAQVVKN